MYKKVLFGIMCASSVEACVCEPNIIEAFMDIERVMLTQNLEPINHNLEAYASQIEKNTKELKAQTAEYKALVQHEAALSLILEKQLFELKKANNLSSNVNKIKALEAESAFKQQENESIYFQKLQSKERY